AGQASEASEQAETFKKNTGLKTERQQRQYRDGIKIAREYYDEAAALKDKTDKRAAEILGLKDFTLQNAQTLLGFRPVENEIPVTFSRELSPGAVEENLKP